MTNTNVLKDLILSSMSPEELQSFRSNKENANPQVQQRASPSPLLNLM
jgi:hypothetical protein